MTDVLGVAASVIAVVQLTGALIALGYDYISAVKSASNDLRDLIDELHSLGKVLTILKDHVQTDKSLQYAALQSLNGQNGPIQGCDVELRRLQLKLEPKDGWRGKMNSLKWPLKEKETYQHIVRIERQKNLFNFALNVDQITLSKAIAIYVENTDLVVRNLQTETVALSKEVEVYTQNTALAFQKIEARVQGLQVDSSAQQSRNQKQDAFQIREKRAKMLRWLYSKPFDTKHIEICSRIQKNTGGWILATPEFCGWSKDPNPLVLWGHGIPGAGKTFLSSVVVNYLKTLALAAGYGVAYIYFDYKEQTEQQLPIHILASLLKQLVGQIASIPEELENLYEEKKKSGEELTSEDLFSALITTSESFTRVFFIFDALDESDHRETLIPLLRRFRNENIKLFVTSRPYSEDIQSFLCHASKIELSAQKQDIKAYIQQKIDGNERAKRLVGQGGCRDRIVSGLVDCAQGMFLLVHFHIEYLCQQTTVRQILKELDKLKLKSPSAEERPLDPTYDRAMEKLRSQPKNCVQLALNILSWLVKARRILNVEELRVAVSVMPGQYKLDEWDLPDRTILTDVCAGLVRIDDKTDTIRLVHYTTQEYLKKEIPKDANFYIAMACTTYLSFNVFARGTARNTKSRLGKAYPFLVYAARYFLYHLKACDQRSTTALLLKFLASPGNVFTSRQAIKSWKTPHHSNPLHLAVSIGHYEVARLLLEGADLSLSDNDQLRLLFDRDVNVRVLLHSKANLSVRDGDQTALQIALPTENEAIIRLLLENGANISEKGNRGRAALHFAALRGDETIVKLLLEYGARIPEKDDNGQAALHTAVSKGSEAITRLLLENGANISEVDNDRHTALHIAVSEGGEEIVKMLLENGADVSEKDNLGQTALHIAASGWDEEILELLLENGADISEKDNFGRTALHFAAIEGSEEITKLLIINGAAAIVPGKGDDGRTALHIVASEENEELAELLLKNGAAVCVPEKDSYGETALHIAASRGNKQIVRLLLEHGAVDVSVKDDCGQTALHIAVSEMNEAIVRLLLENGAADVSEKDNDGQTALHIAASKGDEVIATLLLQNGVCALEEDNGGQTALHIAVSKRNEAVVRLLKNSISTLGGDNSSQPARDTAMTWGSKSMGLLPSMKEAIALENDKSSQAESPENEQKGGNVGTSNKRPRGGEDHASASGTSSKRLRQ